MEVIEARINQGDDEVFKEIVRYSMDAAVIRLYAVMEIYSRASAGDRNDEIVAKARRALLSLPDHANYYLERIEDLSTRSWTAPQRARSIRLLGKLASAGSSDAFAALGDLLQDDRILESDEELEELVANIDSLGDLTVDISSNAHYAAIVLTSMDLPSAPVKGLAAGSAVGAAKLWREWWDDNMLSGSHGRPPLVFGNSSPGTSNIPSTGDKNSLNLILLFFLGIVVLLIPVLRSLRSRSR